MDLRYLRDRSGREIDFVVLKNNQALFAVECKSSQTALSKHLHYFKERSPIPEFYQVHLEKKDFGLAKKAGHSLPFWKFCQIKKLP